MVQHCLDSCLTALRLTVAESREGDLGKLAAIPRYQDLPSLIPCSSSRSCYVLIHETMNKLGLAMQLGQHRSLIDSLNCQLSHESLAAMTSIAFNYSEVCAAFAGYLTTLEQAYHWPRDIPVSTPDMLADYKLVIQMLNQPQLRELLEDFTRINALDEQDTMLPDEIAQIALTLARSIMDEVRITQERGLPIPRDTQDMVNWLYRTCGLDWNNQGDYRHGRREFGRLHEVNRASGTQRRMQELFEESDGLLCLQAMPSLLENLPLTSHILADALTQLQYAVAIVREELFTVSVDEVIWGRAFANFSKAVGLSDVAAAGGDAPVFWMLDSLCGQARPKSQASLPEELNFRSRFFPPNMRDLVDRMRDFPAIRAYCQSPGAPTELKQAFKTLERQRYELYEMHRKKAARISVSLRAGQRGTSAGVSGCAYATPEKTLATTLSTAVTARFGDDDHTFSIDAIAQAHSLMFDELKNVYSARVRFTFSTLLAIGPGDCLLVSVQLPDGIWQTRTYSITYIYRSQQYLRQDAHQIAGAAEVYIRSKGLVSRYLCSQTQGCKIRVAVKPASHFRLVANSNSKETTVFVAQGGALGIFVAWLESQRKPIGKYVLIVAARRFSQLGFKNELIKLAGALKQCLRIVVVLSKPEENDIPLLQSSGIETYHGRANQYLNLHHCSFEGMRLAYVCGTSSFGLEVAKCASLSQSGSGSKAPKRLEPIITSQLPPLRLHVAPENAVTEQLPIIPPAELAQHNSPNDIWIAVGSNVYDITSLSKFHPGGEKILMARAGRQAKDLFESVHGNSVDVQSMLQNMIIGQLTPVPEPSPWHDVLDKVLEIQNDLTNHSRFEKLPGGSTETLPEAPPTQVIYASVECFARDWCSLLQEIGVPKSMQCQLMRAWFGLKRRLDASQSAVYNESFGDVERCGEVLWQVFDNLRIIAGEIHTALDALKSHIAICMSSHLLPDCKVFEEYSIGIVKAIHN